MMNSTVFRNIKSQRFNVWVCLLVFALTIGISSVKVGAQDSESEEMISSLQLEVVHEICPEDSACVTTWRTVPNSEHYMVYVNETKYLFVISVDGAVSQYDLGDTFPVNSAGFDYEPISSTEVVMSDSASSQLYIYDLLTEEISPFITMPVTDCSMSAFVPSRFFMRPLNSDQLVVCSTQGDERLIALVEIESREILIVDRFIFPVQQQNIQPWEDVVLSTDGVVYTMFSLFVTLNDFPGEKIDDFFILSRWDTELGLWSHLEIPRNQFEIPFGHLVGVDDSGRSYYYHNGAVTVIDVEGSLIRVVSEDTLGVGNRFIGISPDGRVLLARPTMIGSTTTWYIEAIEIVTNELGLLRLTSSCSPDPDTVRVWRVRNRNPDPVDFIWDVVGTDQMGSGTVLGGTEETPGEVIFETVAVDGSPNTARIFVGGQLQDQQDSSGEICNQIPTANTQIINWSDHGSRLVIVENEQLTIYDQSLNPIVVKNVSEISDSQILWVRLSPSGDRLFVALQFTGVILDSSTLVPQVEFNDGEIMPLTAHWSNNGMEIAFRRLDGRATNIYATDTGQKLREFDLNGWRDPYELVWSPNGDLFASFLQEYVIILDAQDGSIVDSFDIAENINNVSWSPDGDRIAVTSLAVVPLGTENSYPTSSLSAHRNSVYILDASDGTTVTTITGLPDVIRNVVWSADGSQIAGSDSWRSLYVWDATDGTLLDSFLTRPFQVRFLYFSEYGGRLVVGYGSRAASARDDRDFVPLSTFVFDALGETLQYYVPAPSPTRMTDILSRCVTDPAIAAEGSGYIASEQWGVFLQWLETQPPNILPVTCADDLQLITQVLIGDNQAPIALAGVDQALTDTDNNGSESVTLDGSGIRDR